VKSWIYKDLGEMTGWHFRDSGIARECHLQNSASRLFSLVSSSGGGLPGRLGLERDSRRSLFWEKFLGHRLAWFVPAD
jgi:hypothetical protein